MKRSYRKMFGLAAATVMASLSLGLAAPASAEELEGTVTGVEVDAPIMMMGPDGNLIHSPAQSNQESDVEAMSFTNCTAYEKFTWGQDRRACFNINGSSLWVDSMRVTFDRSRYNNDPYTYVNARFNVDRPNGQYSWGTNGGAVNIMNGYTHNNSFGFFVEPGNWCLRFQVQRNNGVWEPWKEVCGQVRA